MKIFRFTVLLSCFVLICNSEAQHTIGFNITTIEGKTRCQASMVKMYLHYGHRVTVKLEMANHLKLDKAECKIHHVRILDLNQYRRSDQYYIATINHVTETLNGTWICEFRVQQSLIENSCNIDILVKALPDSSVLPTEPSQKNKNGTQDKIDNNDNRSSIMIYLYIGIGVTSLVVAIIIGQAVFIIYLRKKAQYCNRVQRLSVRRSNRNDTARYSAMPGETRKTSKKKKKDKIYESLENLRAELRPRTDISQRPPMPLPEDEDQIYDDGRTLSMMFMPEPPPIGTLPKRLESSKNKSKYTQEQEYDYTDAKPMSLNDSLQNKNKKKPLPPVPKKESQRTPVPTSEREKRKNPAPMVKTKPMGGALMMSELDSKLKIRKAASSPVRTPPVIHESKSQIIKSPSSTKKPLPTNPSARHVRPDEARPMVKPVPQIPAMATSTSQQHSRSHLPNQRQIPGHKQPRQFQPEQIQSKQVLPGQMLQRQNFPEQMPPRQVQTELSSTEKMQRRPNPPTQLSPGSLASEQMGLRQIRTEQMMPGPILSRQVMPDQGRRILGPPVVQQSASYPGPSHFGSQQILQPQQNLTTPENEELYEEPLNTSDVEDDEEWTYEPLPQYNIYNI